MLGGLPAQEFEDGTQEWLMYDFEDLDSYLYDLDEYHNYGEGAINGPYLLQSSDNNLLADRPCYQVATGGVMSGMKIVEGIGIYSTQYGTGLRAWVFDRCFSKWVRWGTQASICYMKNPQGEFEYFNKELYEKAFGSLPSGISDVEVVPGRPTDDRYYNLMGQPVAHPEDAPGIYIHNGKKIVVR